MHPLLSPGAGPIPGVPSQQPSNLFRFGEITLWSTHRFNSGTALANSTNRVFSTQLGQTGQGYVAGLTRTETNLKEGGRIPTGQAYDVYGVAAQVLGLSGDPPAPQVQDNSFQAVTPGNVLQNVVNNGVLAWDFTQTTVDICPIMLAGAGGGVFGSVGTDTAAPLADVGALNNGNGGVWMYRKHPVALPGATTFAVVIGFGSRTADIGAGATDGCAIRIVLIGYYKSVIEIG
jgi:hypothetical protein